MHMKLFLSTLLFVFFVTGSLWANHPIVRNFSRDNYKAGAQNWDITQHSSNAMYFANNAGMLEFDGRSWKTIPIINGTTVHSVHYQNNRFYASTFGTFGYFSKQSNGEFLYQSLVSEALQKNIGTNEIFRIHSNKDVVYFQSNRSIYRYVNDSVAHVALDIEIDYADIAHNSLFVTSVTHGAFMLNANFFSKLTGSEQLINKRVCAILPLTGNKVLFVTSFHGAYLYNGSALVRYTTGIDNFLINNQVFCAAANNRYVVYGTVQRGIAIVDIVSNEVRYCNTYTGLQNNTVLSMYFDNKDNLWLGLDKGIDYVLLSSPVSNLFGSNNIYGAGYSALPKGNTMYLGTNQGLYYTQYPFVAGMRELNLQLINGMEGQVWNIVDVDNVVFAATDRGAYVITGTSAQKIPGSTGTWTLKQSKKNKNLIIGCSYDGLFVLNKVSNQQYHLQAMKGNFSESSPMFEEDEEGNIWFSHWQKGLYKLYMSSGQDSILRVELFNESKGFPTNRNNTVFRVNNELIFSSENGFYTYNKRENRMLPAEKWNSLFANRPAYMRVHQSQNSDIWFASGNFLGLAKLNSDNKYQIDSVNYQILRTKIIVGFENFISLDRHKTIVSTEDGFSLLNTAEIPKSGSVFKVFLSNIFVTNNKEAMFFGGRTIENPNTYERIPKRQNSLRFEFVAPEYRNEGVVEYSIKLKNYDNEWSAFSTETTKEYTQLPKGKYVFSVRARDILESSDAEFNYYFEILPAWYESNLALTVYILIVFVAFIYMIKIINYRSKKGAIEMEKLKEKELNEQKQIFEAETSEKKREIKELKNQQLQYELRHKSQELASSTMNLIRKNEMLLELSEKLSVVGNDIRSKKESYMILTKLSEMEKAIQENIEKDDHWKKFEQNFDLVYENYLKRLAEQFPMLNTSDKKLCAYLKMDLSSKEIASLLNMSVRSVETSRYRLRKKMGLEREDNLSDYLQRF